MADTIEPSRKPSDRLNFSLGYKLISFLLLLIIVGMLYIWKPWAPGVDGKDRVVTETGQATIKAEPDQLTFNPTYSFKNTDKAAALKEMTAKSSEVVSKLKSLGVEDRNIKTNASGYDYERYYSYDSDSKESTYQLSLSVVLNNRDKAQKVQDYLVSTNPTGSVSPNTTFSESKRKSLEKQARELATKEARAKADQAAKNLGFRVGAVKAVHDGAGFGDVYTSKGVTHDMAVPSSERQLAIQPGENELSYTVTVTYFIR
jgi:uncharacterized protein